MANAITIDREATNGRYRDVIDVANRLKQKFGSTSNAIREMVEQSQLFKETLPQVQAERGNGRKQK